MNDFVSKAYDRIAEAYAAARDGYTSLPYLQKLAARLPPNGRVLDIGCGAGLPAAGFLTEAGFEVRGIDISPHMIELARSNVPGATFEPRDMLTLHPEEYQVDGLVGLYSIFHVSREEHARLLRVLRSFLKPGGVILVTMGVQEWEGTEPDFYGTEMFWSHFGPEKNRAMLEAAGFSVEVDEIDVSGGERHQILIGRATG